MNNILMKTYKLTTTILSLLLLAFISVKADTVVGKISDEYSVTSTGQFKYEMHIACVAGTGGCHTST